MPYRETAHVAKTAQEKPRGRIRTQLEAPPKKTPRRPIIREMMMAGGLAVLLGGAIIGAIIEIVTKAEPSAWVMRMIGIGTGAMVSGVVIDMMLILVAVGAIVYVVKENIGKEGEDELG